MKSHHRSRRVATRLFMVGAVGTLVALAACTPADSGTGSTTTTTSPATSTTTTTLTGGGGGPLGTPWLLVSDTNLGQIKAYDTRNLSLQRTISVGGTLGPSIAVVGTKVFYSTSGNQWQSVGEYDLLTGVNNRNAITQIYGGGLLRSSPALPGRLFVGEPGLSPADIAEYDVTGATPTRVAKTVTSAIGSNLIDYAISADGTRLWVACGAPYGLTEVRTTDLATTGLFFPTGAYPQAVGSVRTSSAEYLAGATAPYGQLSIFNATNPATTSSWDPTPGADPAYQRDGLGWSPDGSTAYAVQAAYGGSVEQGRLLTVARTTGVTTTTPVFGTTFNSSTMGQLTVDPGTDRVFVSGADEVDVFNADGSRVGTISGQAGARGMAVTATSLVDLPPRPSIGATPLGPVIGQSVQLTATPTTTEPIVSTTWNFGDPSSGAANTASGASVAHSFSAAGSYTVQATETDDQGATGTASTSIVVGPGVHPVISVVTASPIAGHAVAFSAASSVASVGSITGDAWTFGDPSSLTNTASGVSPSHTFANPGTYQVTLQVTSSTGESESVTSSLTVAAALVPTVTYQPSNPIEGHPVSFTAGTTTTDQVTSASWDFGDSGSSSDTASGTTVSHTFSHAGTFTVNVVESDSAGVTAATTSTVVVGSALTPVISYAPQSPGVGQAVTFFGLASTDSFGSIVSYHWEFFDEDLTADDTTADGAVVSKTFTAANPYFVALTVTGDNGESATTYTVVQVGSPPG